MFVKYGGMGEDSVSTCLSFGVDGGLVVVHTVDVTKNDKTEGGADFDVKDITCLKRGRVGNLTYLP